MKVPGVLFVGEGRRKGLPDNRKQPTKERRHPDVGKTRVTQDINGGAKVTLSLSTIIQTVVVASLLGAASYGVSKFRDMPSPATIDRIEIRMDRMSAKQEEQDKARESSNLRQLAMEKDLARQANDMQDMKNSMKELERIMRRWAEKNGIK